MLREKNYEEAVSILQINIELYPESANTYDSLAYAYSTIGHIEPAIEYYNKALTAIPNDKSRSKDRQQQMRKEIEANLRKLKKKK